MPNRLAMWAKYSRSFIPARSIVPAPPPHDVIAHSIFACRVLRVHGRSANRFPGR
jgi:hypothetical protein